MPEIEKPFRKTGDAAISESPLHPRRKSRRIMVGPVPVGGGAPISVQSMTNTLTADVPATLQQIAELTAAGCDIVRVAVPSQDDADALPEIVKKSPIPVIADIHFQSKYVFQAIDAGCAAVRVNPGNIRKFDEVGPDICKAATDAGISLRIGVNAGSLDKELYAKYGGLTPEALVGVADELNLANAEAVFVAIGDGQISTQNVISHLVRDAGSDEVEQEALPLKQVERTKKTTSSLGISVKGVGDIWVKLARCCMPVPGDKIIGFITRNQGVSVHRVDCQNMLELEKRQPERVVDVQWTSTKGVFMVKIQVEALDRPHLLSDVTRVLSDHGVNIISGSISTGTDRVATSQFSFEMADPQHLNTLLAAVRKIEGVFDVYRITGAKDSAEPRLRKM